MRDFPTPTSPSSASTDVPGVDSARRRSAPTSRRSGDWLIRVLRRLGVSAAAKPQTCSGLAKPLAWTGASGLHGTRSRTRSQVRMSKATESVSAAAWIRAARFITAPIAKDELRSATATRPEATPNRARKSMPRRRSAAARSAMRSRAAGAARTARIASSSCPVSAPKTPTTASPMNFSKRPPPATSAPPTSSKYASSVAFHTSGSRRAASSVEPATSQNTTVTKRRRGAASFSLSLFRVMASPQAMQNRAAAGLSVRHRGHGPVAAPASVTVALTSRTLRLRGGPRRRRRRRRAGS